MQGHEDYVTVVSFSSDGNHIVSGSQDGIIYIWDASCGTAVQGPLRGHDDCVSCLQFTSDGKQIISGSWDRTIRAWDVSSGMECYGPLQGHQSLISSIALSQDGKWIVSGSSDKTVRAWNMNLGVEAYPPLLVEHSPSVDFSSDGTQILAYSNKYVYVWDALKGTCISKVKQTEFRRYKQPVAISTSGWVKDFQTDKIICKLPELVTRYSISNLVTSKKAMALSFDNGQLLIIQFPVLTEG